jgi:hypothetical protein
MRLPKRTLLAAAGIAIASVTTASCSSEEPKGPPTLTAEEATQEYRAEARSLKLAPGAEWPVNPIQSIAEDGVPMIYEPGFGKQAADSHWFCSWSAKALETDATDAQRADAVAELEKIRTTYFYTRALAPESRPVLDKVLASTQLGDFGPLRRDHGLNCTPPEGL